MNPAVDLANALAALKIKRGQFIGTREGTVIRQPGRPDLLLTWEAVQRFAQEIEEARHAD